jgi:predicted O-methyltransferase YrrM
MSKEFGSPFVLEFGTSLGISTMYLAALCPGSIVISLDGCRETSEIASVNFKEAGLTNISLRNGSFDDLLFGIRNEKICPGLVFIDGDHRKEAVIRYFNQVADMSDNNTVVIIDDINLSHEMSEAWWVFQNQWDVTLSLISSGWVVFFREGLNHFNYMVMY